MTKALLLDTHIALWLDSGNNRLRASTKALINDCWRNGGTIFLSSVTSWEIALLVDMRRIELDIPADDWIQRFLDRPGIEGVPLSHRAAAQSYRLQHYEHRDPADRLLIATAMELRCPFVTYDERITQFGKKRGRQQGFSVEI